MSYLYALCKENKKLPIGQGFQSRGATPAAGIALGHKLRRLHRSLTAFPPLSLLCPVASMYVCIRYIFYLSRSLSTLLLRRSAASRPQQQQRSGMEKKKLNRQLAKHASGSSQQRRRSGMEKKKKK